MTTAAQAPQVQFSEANLRKLEEMRKRYPTKQALTLPVLWMAQEQFGWISGEVMKYIAGLLDLPVSHVLGVLSFYTMYNSRPVGKYHLQVCTNVSCMLRGSDRIMKHLSERLGIHEGETTADGRFTITEVECLGSCGTAPMLQVNNDFAENLTPEKLDRLMEGWK
ncbi:MAG TPA: NADH-quinone oxidoreductase subunit NuoE [Bacteroidota bacterium]|nr:NADH-quinone oxidoreductase subunit NuoE [Bacteroidota bacterium]